MKGRLFIAHHAICNVLDDLLPTAYPSDLSCTLGGTVSCGRHVTMRLQGLGVRSTGACAQCGSPHNLMLCSGCESTRFCSR
jgi:hypothetical protein